MDILRVQNLIKYILAEAGQDEDWKSRELAPIHIIKYVYLADMYYAIENEGAIYTGINWQFYHFGPWSPELYSEIPNVAKIIGANLRTFESQYDKEGVRWSLSNDTSDAEKCIPGSILFLLGRDIKNFGSSTYDLLHYVYTTPPITHAIPGQYLHFNHSVFLKRELIKAEESSSQLTVRAKKERKQKIITVRESIARKIQEKKKRMITPARPRYDEIFFNGVMDIDQDIDQLPLENHKGVLQVSPEAWSGEWRKNRDLP